ncbi:hypothetical protein HPB51_028609 [Rhipicephalus microplus]|uniref:Tc1-like transposase DDE domain-containing protein n=1 Tax=Rhipicephalus microplus TaxID=6941 RepID=A0A9J6CX26_RHIMP|nr:hypothetical protein HPB51_028609 [Rhipicephalus microplus]
MAAFSSRQCHEEPSVLQGQQAKDICRLDAADDSNVGLARYEHENIRSVGASERVSVNVWGAITYAGLGPLLRIPGRLTAEVYNEIIDDVLLPFATNEPFPNGCFYFQRDGCPVHNASTVQENLNASGIAQLCWPPKRPDLNIIENVWGMMKARLARANLTNNDADTLWKHVEIKWNALIQDLDLVKSLLLSRKG